MKSHHLALGMIVTAICLTVLAIMQIEELNTPKNVENPLIAYERN